MGNSPREWNDGSAVRLDRQDPYLRLQSVMIFVRDLEQSLSFYLDQLGFQLIFDARVQPGRRFVTVAPPDGTANLTLVAPEPGSEQYKRSEEHTSELQSRLHLVCRLLLEKKKKNHKISDM